jgi:hypothetical protein
VRQHTSALGGERHEGNVAGALDGRAELALMAGTIAGDAAWNDFAALGDQIPQTFNVFVVDVFDLIGTEATDFLALKAPFGRHCQLTSFSYMGPLGLSGSTQQTQQTQQTQ